MKLFTFSRLPAIYFLVGSLTFITPAALAGNVSRPNSTNVTFFDWDHDRVDMHISDKNRVLNVELRRQNGPKSEYFMGEYGQYRVMYSRDTHKVTVINYVNGKEIYNYNFYEVDSTADEGSL
ncbi:MAG: hypothetical protein WCD18_15740 [Thermosynechococcaceae cyanobacterium]